jgi:hypothetical protein
MKLQEIFSHTTNVNYFFSELNDEHQIVQFLKEQKDKGIIFDVAVLSAGGWIADNDSRFNGCDSVLEVLTEANYLTKKRVIDSFCGVYGKFNTPDTFLISSHVSDLSAEQAQQWGQVAYVTSMQKVNSLVPLYPEERLHLLKTERVETDTLKTVRETNPDVAFGMSNDDYAEQELTRYLIAV